MIVAELYRIRKLFLHDGFPCAWSGNAIDNMSAASPLLSGEYSAPLKRHKPAQFFM